MKDEKRTKKQLVSELAELRQRVAPLEALETEQKQAEKALRENEENFRAVAENANEGILVAVGEAAHVYVNKRAAEITGYSMAELLETDMKGLVHPDEFEKIMERYRQRLAGKPVPTRYQTIFIRKDGKSVPVEFAAAKTIWRGEPASVVFFQDITERKQAEEALRAEKSLMDALMDNIPDSIYFKDRQCRLTRINRNMMRSLDLKKMSQALGKTDVDLFGEEFGRETLAQDQHIMTTGKPIIGLIESRRLEDGQINWTSTTKIPLRDASGQIVGLVGSTREINEVKQAEEEAHKRLREITALHKVSEVINSTLDLKEVFQRVVEELSSTFGYRLVGIYLVEGEGLRLQAQVGYDSKTAPDFIPLERGVVGRVARTGQPALIRDVTQDPDYVATHLDITCEICVPVMSGGTTLGTLNVESNDKRPLTDHDLQLLSILGSHIGVAIQNAQLYDKTQRHLKEMTTLQRIGMEITSSLDPSNLLQDIADSTLELTNADYVHLFALDPDSGEFNQRAASWQPKAKKPPITWPRKHKGLTAAVLKTQEPVIIEKATDSPIYATPKARKWGVKSVAGFPLKGKWGVTGVLNVVFLQPHTFSQDELDLLALLADQAAIAIENARLYNKTQRHLKEMTTLQRIGMELTSSLDLSSLLQGIADSTLELIHADYLHLFALDPDTGEFNQRAASWQPKIKELPITWPRKHKGLTAAVLKAQEPVIIEKASDHPIYSSPEARKWGVKSVAGFPLKGKWGVTGVLNLAFLQPHTFSQYELDLLALLADQAAIAIENARLYEKTQKLAVTDPLTNLWNRRYLAARFGDEIVRGQRTGEPCALLVMDVDNFKALNDTYGHATGDVALKAIGAALLSSCREMDIAGRYGGDEFAIILPATAVDGALIVAERLLTAVQGLSFSRGDEPQIPLSLSIGIAIFPTDGEKLDDLFSRADAAMYEAKAAGGNCFRLVSSRIRGEVTSEAAMLTALQRLIEAADRRDHYTYLHSQRVTNYSLLLAEALGLSQEEKDQLELAGLVHDVGNIAIPRKILCKRGRLTPNEWEMIKRHPTLSHMILQRLAEPEGLLETILHHHERYDGQGYPSQLKGERIPLLARILTIADAYAAMTSDRPHRKCLNRKEVIEQLRDNKGKQFDPRLADLCIQLIESGDIDKEVETRIILGDALDNQGPPTERGRASAEMDAQTLYLEIER